MGRILLGAAAASAGALALALLVAPADAPARETRSQIMPSSRLVASIKRYRAETWRWQRRMAKPLTPSSGGERVSRAPTYRRWILALWKARAERARRLALRHLEGRLLRYRAETWRWQRLMGKRLTPTSRAAIRRGTPEYAWWATKVWRKRAVAARRRALRPPRRQAWLCIQSFEAPWKDRHAPYYGGLQMDLTFMRRYGRELLRRKGTADNWTPLEQIWVAERAFRNGRGFYPWPNTARFCGLL